MVTKHIGSQESKASSDLLSTLLCLEKSRIYILNIASPGKNNFFRANFNRKRKAQEISSTNKKLWAHLHIIDTTAIVSVDSFFELPDFGWTFIGIV